MFPSLLIYIGLSYISRALSPYLPRETESELDDRYPRIPGYLPVPTKSCLSFGRRCSFVRGGNNGKTSRKIAFSLPLPMNREPSEIVHSRNPCQLQSVGMLYSDASFQFCPTYEIPCSAAASILLPNGTKTAKRARRRNKSVFPSRRHGKNRFEHDEREKHVTVSPNVEQLNA